MEKRRGHSRTAPHPLSPVLRLERPSLRKSWTTPPPGHQHTQMLVFPPLRSPGLSLHHAILQKAAAPKGQHLGHEKASSPPPPPRPVSRPPPPGLEQRRSDWASSLQEGRPRGWRRQEAPRHARALSTPSPSAPNTRGLHATQGDSRGGGRGGGGEPHLRSPWPPASPEGREGTGWRSRGKEGRRGRNAEASSAPGLGAGPRAWGCTRRARAAAPGTPPPTAHLHGG